MVGGGGRRCRLLRRSLRKSVLIVKCVSDKVIGVRHEVEGVMVNVICICSASASRVYDRGKGRFLQ